MSRRYVRINTAHDRFGVGEIYEVRGDGTMTNDSSRIWYPIRSVPGFISKTMAMEITQLIKQGVINGNAPTINWFNDEFGSGTNVNVVQSLTHPEYYDVILPEMAGSVLTIPKRHVDIMSIPEPKARPTAEAKRFIVTSPSEKGHLVAMFKSFGYRADDDHNKVLVPSSLNPAHVILRENGVYYFTRTLPVEMMAAFPLHTFKVEIKHLYTTLKDPTVSVGGMEYPEAWVADLIEQAKKVPAKK